MQSNDKPKRLLEIIPGKPVTVNINSSSLSLLQTCEQKADYTLNHGFESRSTPAQQFGILMHRALAAWYLRPIEMRSLSDLLSRWSLALTEAGYVPADDKRTSETGIKMLESYYAAFAKDPWEVVKDAEGPIVERDFQFELFRNSEIIVNWFGTVDMVVKNLSTGQYAVMDHKTAGSVGKEFCSRWEVNHQLTGYILGVTRGLGLPTNKAIINGLQVAKTKQQCVRIETLRDADDYREFTDNVVTAVSRYITSLEAKRFQMADSMACSSYGGCRFLEICGARPAIRPRIISSLQQTPWSVIAGEEV